MKKRTEHKALSPQWNLTRCYKMPQKLQGKQNGERGTNFCF